MLNEQEIREVVGRLTARLQIRTAFVTSGLKVIMSVLKSL